MNRELEQALEGLKTAAEFAKTYRFEMTEDYLQLIAQVEALPRNQSGSDKSGRWLGSRSYWDWIKRGRFIDREP
jgi:hypothetical protein